MVDAAILHSLQILQRQYFQLVEPHQLRWPEIETLKKPNVQAWLFTNMFDLDKVKSPPPDRYQLRVLKLVISKLERAIVDPEEDEISDDLMSAMSALLNITVPSEADSAQQKAFVTYSFPDVSSDNSSSDDRTVTLLEARSVISSSGTTGLRTWEAALLLGSYLVSNEGESLVQGKKVFELGAGTGMLSILCAKHLGVAGIVATDGDEAVVDTIKTNLFLNGLDSVDSATCVLRTAALKWGWPVDAATFAEDYGMEAPDVLVGADVTYDKTVIPRLVSTMREFFELNPALNVLISATIRNEQTFETFLNACKRNSFSFKQLDFAPVPEHHQIGPFYPTSTPIQIWHITRGEVKEDPFAF
ncbi:putative methyltransferase-domain-containing protein [Paraphoma chrysanthemicola]|uniref:Methyltransferase-domain-containing protein n=1 Tax=Paraphoma chrysanthemicola TaxID=798071 RepID=A0A8K0QRU6_9PLEO|nr:putative methyltransferase-domain-containing protein [Paraphoma chrysanthemicola]